jgi:hypothetical protein
MGDRRRYDMPNVRLPSVGVQIAFGNDKELVAPYVTEEYAILVCLKP